MLLELLLAVPAAAQVPSYRPAELDHLLESIALYPDPLLAQVLAAATFPDQIPHAAHWADQHHDLAGEALAEVMQVHQLPWDAAVQALLPFPLVLDMMASHASWTTKLGEAFLVQPEAVLDAVQRERRLAKNAGYLKSNDRVAVGSQSYLTIMPVNPAYIFVPSYDPEIVFSEQTAGAAGENAIRFGYAVTVGGFEPYGWASKKFEVIGGYFQAWGWGLGGIDWATHTVIINHTPWRRTWVNRHDYAHPYPDLQRVSPQR